MQGWDGDFPQLKHAQAHVTAPVLRGRLLRTATGARVCDDRETHGERRKPAFSLSWNGTQGIWACANTCSHHMLNDCGVERPSFRVTSNADWSLPLGTCLTDVVCLSSVDMTAAFCEELLHDGSSSRRVTSACSNRLTQITRASPKKRCQRWGRTCNVSHLRLAAMSVQAKAQSNSMRFSVRCRSACPTQKAKPSQQSCMPQYFVGPHL